MPLTKAPPMPTPIVHTCSTHFPLRARPTTLPTSGIPTEHEGLHHRNKGGTLTTKVAYSLSVPCALASLTILSPSCNGISRQSGWQSPSQACLPGAKRSHKKRKDTQRWRLTGAADSSGETQKQCTSPPPPPLKETWVQNLKASEKKTMTRTSQDQGRQADHYNHIHARGEDSTQQTH